MSIALGAIHIARTARIADAMSVASVGITRRRLGCGCAWLRRIRWVRRVRRVRRTGRVRCVRWKWRSWRILRVVSRMFQRASPSRCEDLSPSGIAGHSLYCAHRTSHVFESRFVRTRSTTRDAPELGRPARGIRTASTHARHIVRTGARVRHRSRCASLRCRWTQTPSRRMRNGAVIGLLRARVQHGSAVASVSAVPALSLIPAVRALSSVSTVPAELWMLCAGAMRMREVWTASGSAAT